jgi:hypothetical protein
MAGLCGRTLRTTTVVGVVVALWIWARFGPAVVASFAAGVALGMVLLAAIDFVVQRSVRAPDEEPPARRWPYVAVHVGKLGAAAAVLYLLCRWPQVSYVAVAIGYGLPVAVLLLKLAGMELNRKTGAGVQAAGK